MRWIFLCLGLFLITGCDSNSLIDDLIDEQVEAGPIDGSFANEAVRRTNLARAITQQCGNTTYDAVPSLSWSDQLAEAALAHSKDMAARNYFDHTNLQGEGPGPRISRTGYVARTWGENIAAGYGDLESVIAGWVDSPGHCANIMNGGFTEVGVAVAENQNTTYGSYWTMVLAAPR